MFRILFFIIICLFVSSCERSKNYKEAYISKEKNQLFIKLTGKRVLRPNNPEDIVIGKTYNDSLIIAIPTLKDGIIKGEDIPVAKGAYKFKGNLTIKGKYLEVSLLIDNYDDKKLVPLSWNRKYKLVSR